MTNEEIVKVLRGMAMDVFRVCEGCDLEENCSVRGCAILMEAADAMENLQTENAALRRATNAMTDAQAVMVKQFTAKMEELDAYKSTGLGLEDIVGLKNTCDQLNGINDSLFKSNQEMGKDLAEWKKANDEGRLVVLPCKVEDTVYVINRHLNRVFECTVISISVGRSTDLKNYIKTKWVGPNGNESIRKWSLRQLGKYVFMTREEAEAALSWKVGDG